MNCKKCNSELGTDEKFCAKCGTEVISGKVPFLKRKTGWRRPFDSYYSIAIFVLVIAIGSGLSAASLPKKGNPPSKEDYITMGVKSVKDKVTLPVKIDQYTTLTDVVAEPNAVGYHYMLNGVDPSKISNEKLKGMIMSKACEAKELKIFFDNDINLAYYYAVENSNKTFSLIITKADCQK